MARQMPIEQDVTQEEVKRVLRETKKGKTPGPDALPIDFLNDCSKHLAPCPAHLFSACPTIGYHPKTFRQSRTVVLPKPDRESYQVAVALRPIALLSAMGKILEKIVAERLAIVAEEAGLLPDEHMSNRKHPSTELACYVLTDQVYAVWAEGAMASLLALDIRGAFDTGHN